MPQNLALSSFVLFLLQNDLYKDDRSVAAHKVLAVTLIVHEKCTPSYIFREGYGMLGWQVMQ